MKIKFDFDETDSFERDRMMRLLHADAAFNVIYKMQEFLLTYGGQRQMTEPELEVMSLIRKTLSSHIEDAGITLDWYR